MRSAACKPSASPDWPRASSSRSRTARCKVCGAPRGGIPNTEASSRSLRTWAMVVNAPGHRRANTRNILSLGLRLASRPTRLATSAQASRINPSCCTRSA
ncbi:hypothetical protein FA516_28970 [Pseudomonas aeruginosa]|nr:hypothetical protein CWE28_32435 [Pseudomonas aeruginosa]AYL31872.1 hypothetical protein DN073_21910 [Pseudomonas aeruginosa]AZM86915.1 hypothetical protein EIP87_27020 [Pseudomonas aeruginosa]EIU7109925.1 hypothetical protein [Pseudomonas aeruginosa]EJA2568599.1 hypothetical protein [Pseudomonas aeruginosa]